MKVANNILWTFCLLLSLNSSFAQDVLNTKVSIEFNNQTVEQALFNLGKKIDYSFSYNASKFPIDSLIDLKYADKSVNDIVQDILQEEVELVQKGSHIIIRSTGVKKVRKRTVEFAGLVQDYVTLEPIVDVTVHVLNSKVFTTTNSKGAYSITLETKEEFIEVVFNTKHYGSEIVVIEPKENLKIDVKLKLNSIDKINSKTSQPIVTVVPKPRLAESSIANAVVDNEQQKVTDDLIEFLQDNAWQVSLLPKIGTNGKLSGIVDNTLSLNVLAGYNHGVSGFELGGLLNIIEEDVIGGQIGGFGNIVGRNTEGIQVGGFFNHNFGKVTGIQVGGFSNTVLDSIFGIQVAGFSNVATKSVEGAQVSGFSNVVKESIYGIQASGFGNYSKKISGLQVSGFGNYSGSDLEGSQIAGFGNFNTGFVNGVQISGFGNFAKTTVNGGQISGFINYAKKVNGFQIALINICDTINGIPLGLVNIIRSGYVRHELMASELMAINYAFKSGIRPIYTIWRFGYSERSGTQLGSAMFGLGSSIKIVKHILTTDINLMAGALNELNAVIFTPRAYAKAEWNLCFQVQKHIEVFGGASFNFVLEDGINVSAIPNYAENTRYRRLGNLQSHEWLGYQAGLRINISGSH